MSPPRGRPAIVISDERDGLLDSAGGIVKALPLLGDRPFFILNADTFWMCLTGDEPSLARLALAWDEAAMDILLMLADLDFGHWPFSGGTDFIVAPDGRLARAAGAADGLIYAGAAIVHPAHLRGRVRRAAFAQPLLRPGDRGGQTVRP